MKTIRTVARIREALQPSRGLGAIGLVPTMGAFHAGHVELFRVARRECATVVASLFVNPLQFGDPADLAAYPRDEDRDSRMAAGAGVDFLFAPRVDDLYPQGFATRVDVGGPAEGLEGDFRPGHFAGVATVCLKLFTIVSPAVVFFGQKDAQQVAVVERLLSDLDLPIRLHVVPTVRDADGLALSSRNAHLSDDQRARARAIPRALQAGLAAHRAGRDPAAAARAVLDSIEVDYVAVVELSRAPDVGAGGEGGTHEAHRQPAAR